MSYDAYHTHRLFERMEESQCELEAQIEDSKQALASSENLLSRLQDTMRLVSAQLGSKKS